MQPNEINIFKIARLVGPAGRQQTFSQMEPEDRNKLARRRFPIDAFRL